MEVTFLNFLRPREEMRILEAEKPLLQQVIVQTPLMTGLSPGEFLALHVEDVMWDYNMLYVWRSKVSRDHPAKCNSDTMRLLWTYLDKRKTGPLLELEGSYAARIQRLRRTVNYAARDAEILRWRRVTPYTLRHTFCIKWVQHRGTLEGLRRQLGHRSLQRLQHYLDFDYRHVELDYARVFGPQKPLRLVSCTRQLRPRYIA
jgi:integrase